nr:Uncharacterised protein [Raoultella sp. NCTC 9187]
MMSYCSGGVFTRMQVKKLDIVVAVSSLRKGIFWRDGFSIYQHLAEFYESFREA